MILHTKYVFTIVEYNEVQYRVFPFIKNIRLPTLKHKTSWYFTHQVYHSRELNNVLEKLQSFTRAGFLVDDADNCIV
jgi:hypothetical protein